MDPGRVLRGKYRIERVVGSGGMGTVLLATQVQLGQRVAIKMLHPASLAKPGMLERFAREARAAATLMSEHVVRILDVDETEERVPFLVMEYLVGEDLEQMLKREGPMPVGRAVDIVLEACEALAEAHAVGIVHRDLKPANLFLAKRPSGASRVKVLDFGISKTLNEREEAVSLTTTQSVMGSPVYMSPEQLRASRDVDARTDVWSLGVVLYQLLTNELPFSGTGATAVAACIAADPPRRLCEVRPDAPTHLESVILRCLEKEVGARCPSVLELARALEPFATRPDLVQFVAASSARRPSSAQAVAPPAEQARVRRTVTLGPEVTSKPMGAAAGAPDGTSTETASAVGTPPARASRGGMALLLAGGGVLAITGAMMLGKRPEAKEPPTWPAAPTEVVLAPAAAPSPADDNRPLPPGAASGDVSAARPDAGTQRRPVRPTPRASAAPAASATARAPRNGLDVDIK